MASLITIQINIKSNCEDVDINQDIRDRISKTVVPQIAENVLSTL